MSKKFSSCTGPGLLVGHDVTDLRRTRIAIDDAFDGSPAVGAQARPKVPAGQNFRARVYARRFVGLRKYAEITRLQPCGWVVSVRDAHDPPFFYF